MEVREKGREGEEKKGGELEEEEKEEEEKERRGLKAKEDIINLFLSSSLSLPFLYFLLFTLK